MSKEKIDILEIDTGLDDLYGEMEEGVKVKAVFDLLLNQNIKDFNLKIDVADKKSEIKEANENPAEFVQAVKEHMEDSENKKLVSAEIIEDYKTKLDEGDLFQGLKNEVETLLIDKNEIQVDTKDIMDKACSELGLDKKALQNLVKNKIMEIDPNSKNDSDDKNIVTEGIMSEYSIMISGDK
jgi:hypothetical protein